MNSVIYCFSATGNSLKMAKDIASKLDDTKIIMINRDNMHLAEENKYKRVGIIFPVYYYGLPIMVKEFAGKLRIDKDSYVYTVATCGGSVGRALRQLKTIIAKKPTLLSSAFTVVMPDNYQVMYQPPSIDKQQRLFELEGKKAEYIADKISRLETDIFEEQGSAAAILLGGFFSKTFDPRAKDKNFWTDEECNGCGSCAKICPNNNIVIDSNKPKWLHKCEHCLACMHWCPKHSIQYKREL